MQYLQCRSRTYLENSRSQHEGSSTLVEIEPQTPANKKPSARRRKERDSTRIRSNQSLRISSLCGAASPTELFPGIIFSELPLIAKVSGTDFGNKSCEFSNEEDVPAAMGTRDKKPVPQANELRPVGGSRKVCERTRNPCGFSAGRRRRMRIE